MGKTLNSRSHKFNLLLNNLKLPLKYAIMSLLSNNRVSILSNTLVPFVNQLVFDTIWNSDKFADYGSFIIEQISTELNP